MLAGGEHAPSLKYSPETWLLPVPKIVGDDQALHSQLLRCHGCVNDLIAGRLSRLRRLVARSPASCQVAALGADGACDAHELLRFDALVRRLECVVETFVAQWTARVRRWTYAMPAAEYAREAHALFETVVRFKESLQSVERQLRGGGRALERHAGERPSGAPVALRRPPAPVPLAAALAPLLAGAWSSVALRTAPPTALRWLAQWRRPGGRVPELAKSAAIFGGVWLLFGVGAYFGSCVNDRFS